MSRSPHYSYAVYADAHTADNFDRLRFGGPIGTLLLESQARVLEEFLGEIDGASVLDVGTGTGRAALALAERGAHVTAVDASTEMLRVARRKAAAAGLPIAFLPADAHALQFSDGRFDAAVCLRVLMHAPDWRGCLAELCRVARTRTVFDYPALASAAALQATTRRFASALGSRTEPYRVLSDAAVAGELARHGFRITRVHRQFVLPIALHKVLRSRRVTLGIERAFDAIGLRRVFGSPVTVLAERCTS